MKKARKGQLKIDQMGDMRADVSVKSDVTKV